MAQPVSLRGRFAAWALRRRGYRHALADAIAAAIDPKAPAGIEAVFKTVTADPGPDTIS